MLKISLHSLAFCLLLFSLTSLAQNPPWHGWQQVGKAELRWFLWKIYDSELYTPNGSYQSGSRPLALIITYHTNISAVDLLDATLAQWQHLGYDQVQVEAWRTPLEHAWPDVKAGNKLIYLLQHDGQDYGQIYFQAVNTPRLYSQLEEPGLAKAFIDIWLSPNTSYPKIRQGLIGKN